MNFTPDEAAEILRQISSNQWKWLGTKRFAPEKYPDLADRYAALETHHTQETGRMLEVIKGLSRSLVSLAAEGK
jgi:hypothetical protein